MTERMYRTQILVEPAQQRALAEIAKREGRSISDLVREMIRDQLARRTLAEESARQRRLTALEQIRRHREAIATRRGGELLDTDVVKLLAELREEQDAGNVKDV